MIWRCASRCPATHFGFMKKGKMEVRMKDSDKWMLFEEGDAYFVPPGHLPRFPEDTGAPLFPAPRCQRMLSVSNRACV